MSEPVNQERKTEAPVDRLFVERRSLRAFSDDPVEAGQIATLFEAARWSPSCYNEQPWLFVYGVSSGDRERMLALLAEGNRAWAADAPVLGVVFARRHFARNGKPNRWAAFDSGAASLALALQAHKLGLFAHFMGGFDKHRAHEELGISSETHEAMAAFVVGHPGDPAERGEPTGRKPLAEVAVTP